MSDETKVVALFGETVEGEPDEEVIQRLDDLLARARRGEISGFAYATCTPGGDLGTGWTGISGTRYPLSAAINILDQRYTEALRLKEK